MILIITNLSSNLFPFQHCQTIFLFFFGDKINFVKFRIRFSFTSIIICPDFLGRNPNPNFLIGNLFYLTTFKSCLKPVKTPFKTLNSNFKLFYFDNLISINLNLFFFDDFVRVFQGLASEFDQLLGDVQTDLDGVFDFLGKALFISFNS